jgi:hypothetical protein
VPILTCPACGLAGEAAGTDEFFEHRGRHELMEVRKCRRCGAGLFVRFSLMPTEAEAELIPEDAWAEMERVGSGRAPNRRRDAR